MMAHNIKSGLECSVEMVNKRYGHPIVYLRIPQIAATPGLVNFILGKIECLHFSVAYKKRVGSHNGSKHRQWLVVIVTVKSDMPGCAPFRSSESIYIGGSASKPIRTVLSFPGL